MAQRIEFAFLSVMARRPSANELRSLNNLVTASLAEFQASVESARKLLATGESSENNQLNASELAAWTMVTHLILNLSEAVTKG